LGTQAKLAAVRTLVGSAVPLSCQEIARRTSMTFRSLDLALKDLVALGIVAPVGGRQERLLRFHAEHRLAAPIAALVRAERDFYPALRSEIGAMLRSGGAALVAAAFVGPVATGQERVSDPIRIVLITEDSESVRRWVDQIVAATEGLWTRYGLRLEVTGYDLQSARRMWTTRTAQADRLVADADILIGPPLESLLAGT